MQQIQDFIEQKARELESAPILSFLRDQSIDPRQRFSFTPCMAPWVLGFADINKFALRDESSQDPIQQVINIHTQEDDHHWNMYLKDLWTLGMNDPMDLCSAIKLLWGDENRKARQIVYSVVALTASASPLMRMVILKSVEEASSVAFKAAFQAAEEFRQMTGERLFYFGDAHLEMESGHTMRTADAEERIDAVQLTPEQRQEARVIVEKVFQLIRDMIDEFLAYAQRHPRPMPLPRHAAQGALAQHAK